MCCQKGPVYVAKNTPVLRGGWGGGGGKFGSESIQQSCITGCGSATIAFYWVGQDEEGLAALPHAHLSFIQNLFLE